MRKLRQFQDLGHEVTFSLEATPRWWATHRIKTKRVPFWTEEQVAQNALTYAEQAFRVLDRAKTIVRYNGEWLSELSLVI